MSELDRRLRRWRFERLRGLWLEGSMRLCAGLAAYVLAALALDALFALPQSARWVLFGLGAGAAAAAGYAGFLRPLELLAPARILRAAALRHPSAGAYLRSAWELSRFGAGAHTSDELAREHIRRTEELLEDLPREEVFSWKPSPRSSRGLTFVAAAWGLGLPWLQPGSTGLGRVLSPWRDARLESLASILPGDAQVPWGEAAVIEARWLSPRPGARLLLELRAAGSDWRKVPWDREGSSSYRVEGLAAPLEYRVGYKDLRSRSYRLTPVPFPRLKGIKARVRLPGLADRGEVEVALEGGGELAALRGSWVSLRGMPDQPLSSALLEVSGLGAPVRMRRLDGGEWEGGFPLNENGTLKFDLTGAGGARDPDPVAYSLRAVDDAPPVVELLSPAFELEISPKERLPIAYSARDDYGLASISLVYQVFGRGETEIPLKRFAERTKDVLGDYSWDLSRLPLGARVEFWLKAYDDARPKPQVGLSAKGALRLADFEAAHEAAERKWLRAQDALDDLAAEEARAGRLARDTSGPWSDTLSRMEDLARSVGEDPYANPGTAQTAGTLAELLKALRDTELAKALQAARSGDNAEAQRRHAGLASRLNKAAEMLSSGRELQAMQDFLGQAYRMDQAGSELKESLDKLVAGGKAGPEERKKLDQALAGLRKEMDALAQSIDSLPKADPGSFQEGNRKVYSIPLNSARSTAAALQAALDRGDYSAAAKLAGQLSSELAQMRSAVSSAARSAIEEGPEEAAARAMAEAAALWKEAVEGQSRGLQMTQTLEARAQAALRSAQQDLLAELARAQAVALRDAAKLGPAAPADILEPMKQVLKEFEASQVREAPKLLDRIIHRLQAPELSGLAEEERGIRERLAEGAKPPSPGEGALSEMAAAEAAQRQATKKTADLRDRLGEVGRTAGVVEPKLTEPVERAAAEQRAAEEAFGRRDAPGARSRQEKALEFLEEGLQGMEDAVKRRQAAAQGASGAFSGPRGVVRRAGPRGSAGADMGLVPLPRAEDYQPPREIRGEVEKSLRERRPSSLDGIIKDYFKRMSQ